MASEELATVHELLRGFDLEDLTIAERRAAMTSAAAPPPPGTTVEPVDAGGVPAEWVVAAGVDSVHVPLYLHGGAYQVGAPAMLRRMIALISAAARFLLTGGADPAAIAIAGDSSGGGLALTTLVALRDAGYPLPAAAVAMSPWTDLALTGESMSTRADVDLMIKPDGMRESAATYLAGRATPGADRQPQFGVLPREDVFPDEDIFGQNT